MPSLSLPAPYADAYVLEHQLAGMIRAAKVLDQMRNPGHVDSRAGDLALNTTAPFITWGAYTWGNGTSPRSDGLVWLQSDFLREGTRPSPAGIQKTAGQLLTFFQSSMCSRPGSITERVQTTTRGR